LADGKGPSRPYYVTVLVKKTVIEKPARMLQRKSNPSKIAILGGDLLVSRSLEAVLRSGGYDARFLTGSFTDEPTEPLHEEVRLVIFAPRTSTERRKAYLSRLRGTPATARIPVLELVTSSNTLPNGREELVELVFWPCPTEELERVIEAALLNGANPKSANK
jgi:hypothetical protein